MRIRHFLITRFNIEYLEIVDQYIKMKPEKWLSERLYLFYKYSYPSIVSQSVKNFTWYVFFDPRTPKVFLDNFKKADKLDLITIGFFDTWKNFNSQLINYLNENISESEFILTTRLDSDDALRYNSIQLIQEKVLENIGKINVPFILNFNNGYVFDIKSGIVFKHKMSVNPFISLVTSSDSQYSVFTYEHNKVKNYFNYIDFNNIIFWLQIVHYNNFENHKIGYPIPKNSNNLIKLFGLQCTCHFSWLNYFIELFRFIFYSTLKLIKSVIYYIKIHFLK